MMSFLRSIWQRIPRNALWLYGGSLAAGALNYLYNIVMARPAFLGPQNFGALAALGALLYLEGVMASTVITVSTNYTATILGAGEDGKIRGMVRRLSGQVLVGGIVLAILLLSATRYLTRALHLSSAAPILILTPIMIVTLLVSVIIGVLQGSRAFGALSAVTVLGAFLRLVLAMLLVSPWHLGLSGALVANLAAALVVLAAVSLFVQRHYPAARSLPADGSALPRATLWGYSGYVFAMVFGLTSLFSADIVLAQHYLPTMQASLYASLSTLGRIIYFATIPITIVMFSTVSQRLAAQHPYRRVLLLTGTSMAIICAFLGIFYALVPAVIIRYTVGAIYAAGAADLWLYAAFFSALSLATWLAHFLLARRQMTAAFLPTLCLVFQIVFILRDHGSPHAIIRNSLTAAVLLLTSLSAMALLSPSRRTATFTPYS